MFMSFSLAILVVPLAQNLHSFFSQVIMPGRRLMCESTDPNGHVQNLQKHASHVRQFDEYALILLLTDLTSVEYFDMYEVCTINTL